MDVTRVGVHPCETRGVRGAPARSPGRRGFSLTPQPNPGDRAMRPIRGAASLLALACLLAADGPARAAWDNVFQVSCFFRHRRAVANLAPACCPPAAPAVAA